MHPPVSHPPIKVLHLITGLGVGGAETMLVKVLAVLDRTRFSSSVVSMTEPGALAGAIMDSGIPVHTLGMNRGNPQPMAITRLVTLLREFRPDILQTWMYHADLLGLVAARAARVPQLIWNIRCSDLDLPNATRSLRFVFRAHAFLSRFTDATIVNSECGMHFHQRHGHAPRRWELIPNGFDTERFRADPLARAARRAELRIAPEDAAIGMVARFDQFKDHDTFIAAAKILRATVPKVVFVLAGRGMTADNKRIVASLRAAELLKHTRLLGEYADPSQLLPALDISTLCSHTEGFPNTVGEAMSCEVPCVATDVGDSGLLMGDTGRTVPPRDPEAVAARWSELIALGVEGRRQIGAAARRRIQDHFSLRKIGAAYDALYTELRARADTA